MSRYLLWAGGIVIAAVLVGATYVLAGSYPAAVVLAIVVGVGLGRLAIPDRGLWGTVAIVVALLGGLVGAASAAQAIVTVGGERPYETRVGLGWAALAFAIVPMGAPIVLRDRPGLAAAIIAVSGLAGSVAINLFWINSFYLLALPLWLIAVVALLAAPRPASKQPDSE